MLVVVVFLVVLWPTRQSGARLLRTWGIAEPSASQTGEAVRYLRHRRIQEVDAALRTRTARVAVAVGFGWLAVLAGRAQTTLVGMYSPVSEEWLDVMRAAMTVVLFGSIVAWIRLAVPTRRCLARSR